MIKIYSENLNTREEIFSVKDKKIDVSKIVSEIIETVKKSGAESEDYLLVGKDTVIDGNKFYGDELDAEILQLTHHGYSNTDAGPLYDLVKSVEIVLWPVSTGHYDGSGGANVSGVSFNQRFFKNGIANHVAGETNMTITDFTTWTPEKDRWLPKV